MEGPTKKRWHLQQRNRSQRRRSQSYHPLSQTNVFQIAIVAKPKTAWSPHHVQHICVLFLFKVCPQVWQKNYIAAGCFQQQNHLLSTTCSIPLLEKFPRQTCWVVKIHPGVAVLSIKPSALSSSSLQTFKDIEKFLQAFIRHHP